MKNDKKEQKPFEYDELFAMCYLCAGWSALIAVEKKFTSPEQGREMIEKMVKETIDIRWNAIEKNGCGNA